MSRKTGEQAGGRAGEETGGKPGGPMSGEAGGLPKAGYLGPEGTFSEEALLRSARPDSVEPTALPTIYEAVVAVRTGAVRWAVVPIENSLDGSVTVTLDLLADEQGDLEIVGETLLEVRHALIAAGPVEMGEIDTVISHPQVPGQCTRLLRGDLAHAQVVPASSTAEAVRIVATEGRRGQAALGTKLAAEIYGATVLREGVQDSDENVTRFVWLARTDGGGVGPGGTEAGGATQEGAETGGTGRTPPLREGGGEWKTSVVFWGWGAESPGWLVRCLNEFAEREINLTKIESRPRRERLGHYVFFADLAGRAEDDPARAALRGLRAVCEEVRVLGAYPAA
jgi:prephenate dehydratase